MTRRMAIRTKSTVKFYDMAGTDRPLSVIENKIYRSDESFMIYDITTGDQFALYDLDGVIPYAVEDPPSQDETMTYIDIMRGNKKATASPLGKIGPFLRKNFPAIIIGLVIVVVLANNYLK